jgi:hypothetical protein
MILAFLLVATPLSQSEAQAIATADDYNSGYSDGQKDGHGEGKWFFAGFCLGGTGILLAYLVEPAIDASHLIGKSADYTRGYMDGYKDSARRKNVKSAINGCILLVVAIAVVYTVLIVVILSETDGSLGNGGSWGSQGRINVRDR